MQVAPARPATPAEQCLYAIWDARVPLLAILILSVAGAAILTAMQPKRYTSQAILGVKPPPQVLAEAKRAGGFVLSPNGVPYDANDADRQSGPGRYAPRLTAPGLVTLAARDVGLLDNTDALDAKRVATWVEAERIEASDLIILSVTQPSADAAQKLANAIVARGLEANGREEALQPQELRRQLTVIDAPTRPSAPSFPRPAVNVSVGLGLGILAASVFVALRHASGTRSE